MFTKINDMEKLFSAMNLLQKRLDQAGPFTDAPLAGGWIREDSRPGINLYEDQDDFVLISEMPGVRKEDLKVRVQGNYLEISGVNHTDIPEGYKAHRSERDAEAFTRTLTLPADVDTGRVEATLKQGMLVLTLPKAEAAKPKRIEII